ncbi:MAG TPA: tripartite tricarboxylate transporter TctB family protein [Alphaproteobacteria bacterium]
MQLIRNPRDFYAGLLFVAFGIAALVIAQSYPVGTASRMGPGYFPRILGILLVALGALQSLIGMRGRAGFPLQWHWRPLFILLASVALFILLTSWLGLIVAALVLVFIASAASAEFRWREALIAGAVQGVAAATLFVYALGLPLPVWPPFFGG